MPAARGADGHVVNRRRQFGTMLLSRFPILWSRLHLLPMRKVVRPLNTQNAALEGLIRTPSGPVRVFSIHLSHIGVEERLEQIAFLKARHRRVPFEGGPWSGVDDEPERDWSHGESEPEAPLAAIWMGDFNCEPGSEEYLAITGRNPYRPSAAYLDAFVDAAVAAGGEAAAGHTHVRIHQGKAQKRRLDYCFVGSMLASRVRSVQRRHGLRGFGPFPGLARHRPRDTRRRHAERWLTADDAARSSWRCLPRPPCMRSGMPRSR